LAECLAEIADEELADDTIILGIHGEFSEFQARTQKLKSFQSKIHMAQRGVPSVGSLPFGRTFDKKKEK